jgi:hypothetical protein
VSWRAGWSIFFVAAIPLALLARVGA